MIVKAIALVCTVMSGGESECKTIIPTEEFSSIASCQQHLTQWRLYGLPRNKKITLDDCVVTSYKHE
jgi:hypothetical protein